MSYMADMERVEVLEGPQGTLFGGGAEAGAIRYITNKPKLNVTEANVEASYGTTAHGFEQFQCQRDTEFAVDTRYAGGALRHLYRSAGRLHRQCPEHLYKKRQ